MSVLLTKLPEWLIEWMKVNNEREEGHADTRSKNFECEGPDEHLGRDLGIDVQG